MCSECFAQLVNEVKSSVDIAHGSSVEIVDEFCYLGDMLSASEMLMLL